MTTPDDRTLAILGAGPTGIEAALAAADAGIPFVLFEAGDRVGRFLADWGHVRLFSPWDLDLSPRMRRHLESAGIEAPSGDACPTGAEVQQVLAEIARLPAIAPHLRLGHRVRAVGREGLLKHQAIGDPARADARFRLLVEGPEGERIVHARTVIDTTGTYDHPNAVGDGGIEAPGEAALDRSAGGTLVRQVPDLLGDTASETDAGAWAGKRILLIGAGHSAKTAAVDLATLIASHPETRVTWALRRAEPVWKTIENDALPARNDLIVDAQAIAQAPPTGFDIRLGVVVDRFAQTDDGIAVTLRSTGNAPGHGTNGRSTTGHSKETLVVDRILALTGFVGDHRLYRQLQIHECYATNGPIKLAAALLGSDSADCMTQESQGVATLTNPEPNFFILGSKSYGRNTTFLMRVGWEQVDEVFGALTAPG